MPRRRTTLILLAVTLCGVAAVMLYFSQSSPWSMDFRVAKLERAGMFDDAGQELNLLYLTTIQQSRPWVQLDRTSIQAEFRIGGVWNPGRTHLDYEAMFLSAEATVLCPAQADAVRFRLRFAPHPYAQEIKFSLWLQTNWPGAYRLPVLGKVLTQRFYNIRLGPFPATPRWQPWKSPEIRLPRAPFPPP